MLVQIKSNVISEHLIYDANKLTGTVSKCIIMSFSFRTLLGIVVAKSFIVLNNVVSRIYECEAERSRAAFRHLGMSGFEVTGLINSRIQSGKCEYL